jgi:hypothetical protein
MNMMALRTTLRYLRRCVDRLMRKSFKKLNKLQNRTNDKGKEFLKGLMDDKETWSLAHDKGGKCCGYMMSNMDEIFHSMLRGVTPCLSQQ